MNIGTEWILRFQNGCYIDKDVFVLRVTQFWFEYDTYLWFQIELALGARPILKSRVWQD